MRYHGECFLVLVKLGTPYPMKFPPVLSTSFDSEILSLENVIMQILMNTHPSSKRKILLYVYLFLLICCLSGKTGIEPATSGVTSQYSNQLSYFPKRKMGGAGLRRTRKAKAGEASRALISQIFLFILIL